MLVRLLKLLSVGFTGCWFLFTKQPTLTCIELEVLFINLYDVIFCRSWWDFVNIACFILCIGFASLFKGVCFLTIFLNLNSMLRLASLICVYLITFVSLEWLLVDATVFYILLSKNLVETLVLGILSIWRVGCLFYEMGRKG